MNRIRNFNHLFVFQANKLCRYFHKFFTFNFKGAEFNLMTSQSHFLQDLGTIVFFF